MSAPLAGTTRHHGVTRALAWHRDLSGGTRPGGDDGPEAAIGNKSIRRKAFTGRGRGGGEVFRIAERELGLLERAGVVSDGRAIVEERLRIDDMDRDVMCREDAGEVALVLGRGDDRMDSAERAINR